MQDSCRRISFVKSRMRKSRTSGSVRGIPCKGYVYLTIKLSMEYFFVEALLFLCYNEAIMQKNSKEREQVSDESIFNPGRRHCF